jgi:hypothetical protein
LVECLDKNFGGLFKTAVIFLKVKERHNRPKWPNNVDVFSVSI